MKLASLHLEPTRLEPYPFQEADIEELLAHDATGFVVAETGAGKSLIAIETGLRSPAKTILVVAIAPTVGHVWVEGILGQDPTANVQIIDGTKEGKQAMYELELGYSGWYIMTTQLFTRWDITTIRPDLTIVDEAHLLANREKKGFTDGLNKLRSKRRMVMSGTIYRNKFENFWSLLRFVYPDRNDQGDIADTAYRRWEQTFCRTEYDHFAPGNIRVDGELIPGRLASLIPCYIQHFKRQQCCVFHPNGFLADLPEPINIQYSVELTVGQKKAIDRMESEYMAWLSDQYENRKALVAKLPIVAQTRLRQMTLGLPSFLESGRFDDNGMPIEEIGFAPGCESPKLDLFSAKAKASGEPYLALTTSEKFATEATRRLRDDYGIPTAKWAGTVPKSERERSKQEFIAGDIQVVVGVVEAVSTGIDGLQLAAWNAFHFDQSRDVTSEIQVEGRLDRRGQTNQVVNEYAMAEGSMDFGVYSQGLHRRLQMNASLKRELKKQQQEERRRA